MRPIKLIRKSLAVLLAAVLLIGLVPAGAAISQPASGSPSEPSDVWDAITALEEEKFAEMPRLMDGDDAPTAEDFARVVDDVAELVTSRSDYVEGSFLRNGDFFSWRTTDGIINGYSPALRAEDETDGLPTLAGGGTSSSGRDDTETATLMDGGTSSKAAVQRLLAGEVSTQDLVVFTPWTCPSDATEEEKANTHVEESFTSICHNQATVTATLTGGQADWIQGNDVTVDTIARAIESYGVVMIFTHGRTDYNYAGGDQYSGARDSYLQIQSNEGLTQADYTYGLDGYDKNLAIQDWYKTEQDFEYLNQNQIPINSTRYYPHCFKFVKYAGMKDEHTRYAVDGFTITRHMTKRAPDNMVYFMSCLTMATDGLWKPLREKGVEVVYGYSQCISFNGAEQLLPRFMDGLRRGMTAGEAFHTMREQVSCDWDPVYWTKTKDEAISSHRAFPYMVSPEDEYFDRNDYSGTIVLDPKSTWRLPLLSDWNPETGETTVSLLFDLNEAVNVPFLSVASDMAGGFNLRLEGEIPKGINRNIKAQSDAENYRQRVFSIVGTAKELGYYEPTLTIPFNQAERKYRFKILVTDNTKTETSGQTASAFLGQETEIPFQLRNEDEEGYFSVEQTYGQIPDGMTLFFEGSSVPCLVGTPTRPGTYSAVFMVRKNNGRLIKHTLRVQVTPTETLDTSQSVVLTGNVLTSVALDTGLSLADGDIRSVGKTTGSIPGLSLEQSMDRAPRLTGRPSAAGEYSMTILLYLADGRAVNHTVYATVQQQGETLDRYVIDVSSGRTAEIKWEDYNKYLRPALKAAAQAGQIDFTQGSEGGSAKDTINVDKDKGDNSPDIEFSKVMNSYCFSLLPTASQSGSYLLELSPVALRYLSSDTSPGAKKIEFIFSEVYGLKVYNKQVTSANRENIFKGEWYGATTNLDGVFSYDGAGTLTIKGSLWNNLIDIPIVESDIPLTINVLEYSHLGCGPSAIVANRDLTITGPGVLEVESNDAPAIEVNNGSTLTIRDMELRVNKYKASFAAGPVGISDDAGLLVIDHAHVKAFGQEAALTYFDSIELENCQIAAPEKGSVEYGSIVDSSGEPATEVEIIPCEATYDLWINGVQVTNLNAGDVLGDGTDSKLPDFSYSPMSRTLTIHATGTRIWNHDPDRGFPMIKSRIQGLTIQVEDSIILRNNGTGGCFLLEGDTVLTGEHLSLVARENAAIRVGNDATFTIRDLGYLSIVTNAGPGITGSPSPARVSAERLVLDHVDHLWIKTWNSGGAIENFNGGAGIAAGDYETRIKSPAAAMFFNGNVLQQDGGPVYELVIGKTGQTAPAGPIDPTNPEDTSVPPEYVEPDQSYDLRVDGIPVDSDNQDNILGDGNFSYDSESNTLTVSGSHETSGRSIIENGIPDLVVNVTADAKLKVSGSTGVCILALADTTVTGSGKLTLEAEGAEALGAGYGASLSLKDLVLDVKAPDGIRGSAALLADNCEITVESEHGGVWDFGQGILLDNCTLLAGSLVQQDGRWCVGDSESSAVKSVSIGKAVAEIKVAGDTLTYSIPLNAGGAKGTTIAAWYNDAGQMLGTSQAEITMDGLVKDELSVEPGAHVYKLFVLDANGSPVLQAWSSAE